MHDLEPNTKYRFLVITVAIPERIEEGQCTDAFNEVFNEWIQGANENSLPIGDWKFNHPTEIRGTSDDPQEGELFRPKPSFDEFFFWNRKYPECLHLEGDRDCLDRNLNDAEQCDACKEYVRLCGEYERQFGT